MPYCRHTVNNIAIEGARYQLLMDILSTHSQQPVENIGIGLSEIHENFSDVRLFEVMSAVALLLRRA